MDAGNEAVTGDEPYRDPRWNWPEYAAGAVVELRVHGIGGEGPEGMTRDPHPVQVGGDEDVGFWRARNPRVLPPVGGVGRAPDEHGRAQPDDAANHVREVVSWGGSTSGTRRSAFWVLLLPFALFNAAGRMTRPGAPQRLVAVHQAICRVLAVSLTVAVVALTTSVVIDLVAVQCGAQPVCREADLVARWLLAPLRAFHDDAATLVGLLSLLPIVAVYMLRIVGRRGLTRAVHPWPPVQLRSTPAQRLHEPDFWQSLWPAWRLRGIHITAGYAWTVVVLSLVLPPLLPDLPTWVGRWSLWLGVGSLVGNALLAALPRTAAAAPDPRLRAGVLTLRAVTLVALGTLVGAAFGAQVEPTSPRWAGMLLAAAGLLAAALAAGLYVRHLRRDGSDAAGPSGAWRDALTAVGVLCITLALDVGGDGRIAASDALARLGGDRPGGWVLGDAPQAVYLPLLVLVAVQVLFVAALLVVSLGPADRGRPVDADGETSSPLRSDRGPLPTAALPWNTGAPAVALLSLVLVTAIGSGIHGAVLDWLGNRADCYAVVEAALARGPATPPVDGTTGAGAPGVDCPGTSDDEDARDASPTGVEGTGAEQGDPTAEGVAAVAAVAAPRARLQLALPWWQPWTALAVALIVVVFAATTAGFWFVLTRRQPTEDQVTEALGRSLAPDPPPADDAVAAARARVRVRVVRSWHLRVLTERSGQALFVAISVSTLLVVAVFAALLDNRQSGYPPPPWASLWMLGLATVPALAVAAIRTAREDRGVRRELGRLWDVLAFWPRVTHPFAPPSYGEALVPAVAARVEALTSRGHPVILAGHSQGSIVAVAATLQLPRHERRLHLVTYGSPVRLLYEGLFPGVFGGDEGAIACATPSVGTWPPDPAPRPPVTPPSTWHNVLALGEPIGTPLWHWSVEDDASPTDGDDGVASPTGDDESWDVLLRLPSGACPVCGWTVPGAPPAVPRPRPAIDMTITDPDRVTSPSGEVDGIVAGHLSYHRSRELDLHLRHLARATAASTPATPATDDEAPDGEAGP